MGIIDKFTDFPDNLLFKNKIHSKLSEAMVPFVNYTQLISFISTNNDKILIIDIKHDNYQLYNIPNDKYEIVHKTDNLFYCNKMYDGSNASLLISDRFLFIYGINWNEIHIFDIHNPQFPTLCAVSHLPQIVHDNNLCSVSMCLITATPCKQQQHLKIKILLVFLPLLSQTKSVFVIKQYVVSLNHPSLQSEETLLSTECETPMISKYNTIPYPVCTYAQQTSANNIVIYLSGFYQENRIWYWLIKFVNSKYCGAVYRIPNCPLISNSMKYFWYRSMMHNDTCKMFFNDYYIEILWPNLHTRFPNEIHNIFNNILRCSQFKLNYCNQRIVQSKYGTLLYFLSLLFRFFIFQSHQTNISNDRRLIRRIRCALIMSASKQLKQSNHYQIFDVFVTYIYVSLIFIPKELNVTQFAKYLFTYLLTPCLYVEKIFMFQNQKNTDDTILQMKIIIEIMLLIFLVFNEKQKIDEYTKKLKMFALISNNKTNKKLHNYINNKSHKINFVKLFSNETQIDNIIHKFQNYKYKYRCLFNMSINQYHESMRQSCFMQYKLTIFKHIKQQNFSKFIIEKINDNHVSYNLLTQSLQESIKNQKYITLRNVTLQKHCAHCHKKCVQLKSCVCRVVVYCNRKCQKRHWVDKHNTECRKRVLLK